MFTEFSKTSAPPWTGAAIAHFVHQRLKTTYDRLFDIASQVAQRREGDCTEYAVLTTALSRAAGMQARVAMGVALVPNGAGLDAFGHAWVEVMDKGRWIVVDATNDGALIPVRYLPTLIMEEEGSGYALAMAPFNSTFIQRVVVRDEASQVPSAAEDH